MLKLYALNPNESRGRLFNEPLSIRSQFQRDRDRIIHSASFRRLEYKTQVFVNSEGDHFRTRLTHTLEVAQIARVLASRLGLNVDIAEAFALAHDLGHPPFGHAGEDALNEIMNKYGGFNHNEYVIKLLTVIENKYLNFRGLNLTYETLEGIIKHNGPIIKASDYINEISTKYKFNLDLYPTIEAQIASLADDIAYNNHDIDDGFRAGILQVEDFRTIPFLYNRMQEIMGLGESIPRSVLVHETLRAQYTRMIDDLVENTEKNLIENKIKTVADVENFGGFLAAFSEEVANDLAITRKILYSRLYKHKSIDLMCQNAQTIIKRLFKHFLAHPELLKEYSGSDPLKLSEKALMQLICDYIAGMTDRYAQKKIQILFK
ncbi:MAG: deoxyguanosinetriphosphate triphosphohydrolase [Rickettsiales bacterium]|nr:deoxyguanosinetriphosphate triphosphohydrolase [Rickettsiales bacterium]